MYVLMEKSYATKKTNKSKEKANGERPKVISKN